MVGGFVSVRNADRDSDTLKEHLPFARHKVSRQATYNRRYQLKSWPKPDVEIFCRHVTASLLRPLAPTIQIELHQLDGTAHGMLLAPQHLRCSSREQQRPGHHSRRQYPNYFFVGGELIRALEAPGTKSFAPGVE